MATYMEIRDLFSDDNLKNKIDVAVVNAAGDLLNSAPTADEQKWAAAVFANPRSEAEKAYMFVLSENRNLAVSAIQGASDAAIQSAVDTAVASLVIAYNAASVPVV